MVQKPLYQNITANLISYVMTPLIPNLHEDIIAKTVKTLRSLWKKKQQQKKKNITT